MHLRGTGLVSAAKPGRTWQTKGRQRCGMAAFTGPPAGHLAGRRPRTAGAAEGPGLQELRRSRPEGLPAPAPGPRSPGRPFFDGWFLRVTDPAAGLSLAVVLGLFWNRAVGRWAHHTRREGGGSKRAARPTQEHYICVSVGGPSAQGQALESAHLFPKTAESSLKLSWASAKEAVSEPPLRQAAIWLAPTCGRGELRYESSEHGIFEVTPSGVRCQLHGMGSRGLPWELEIDVQGALKPWAPEGWLRHLAPLGILPCRYTVHTLGTPARYDLRAPGGLANNGGTALELHGCGSAHLETNHGESFPQGWLYAQGTGVDGAKLVLTGGRFVIGPVTTVTWLLCLRLPGLPPLDFRTIDLDAMRVRRLSFKSKELVLEASRPWHRGGSTAPNVTLQIRAPASSYPVGGGLFVPTVEGFARSPGALESFDATAEVRVRGLAGGEASYSLRGCVLEFGGSFQDPELCRSLETAARS